MEEGISGQHGSHTGGLFGRLLWPRGLGSPSNSEWERESQDKNKEAWLP